MSEQGTVVDRRISPDERMPHKNEDHYFAVGESAFRCIDAALTIAGRPWDSIESVLDLPCGHGRVLRNLRSRLPSATIYACDLMEDGVQYCADTFGAVPVVSVPDPADLVLPGPFDLIWCGSLLTHLRAEDCIEFMRLFERHLTPGGVAVVTLHGRDVLRRIREGKPYGLGDRAMELVDDVEAHGFAYRDHDGQSWGISASTPAWAFDHLVGDLRLIGFTEAGWDDHQDVLACQRPRS